jgi:hypothetical protein
LAINYGNVQRFKASEVLAFAANAVHGPPAWEI